MKPDPILQRLKLKPQSISRFVVSIEPPLPPKLTKAKLLNLLNGLTANGHKRKGCRPNPVQAV